MEIMVDKRGYTEEKVKIVKNVGKKYYVRKCAAGALTGVLIAKNN